MSYIGDKIKKERKAAGLTQKQLAEKLGTTAAFISNYERGERRPKFETLVKIADALGVNVSDLNPLVSVTIDGETMETIRNIVYSAPDVREAMQKLIGEAPEGLQSVIDNYESVNAAGKQKIEEYSADIAATPKYQDKN